MGTCVGARVLRWGVAAGGLILTSRAIAAPTAPARRAGAPAGAALLMDDFRPLRAAVLGPMGQPLAHHVPPPPPREEPALLPLSFDLSCKHDRTIPFQCQARLRRSLS